jgi:endoglycosylceramidase
MLRLRPLCLAGLVLLALAGSARAATPVGWMGTVRAPGGPYLTDGAGRRLQLHGADLVAKCGGGAAAVQAPGQPCIGPARGPHLAYVLSPTARDPGRRFTAADARTLARLGFNVVRLGVIWEGLEPGPHGARPDQPRYCAPQPAGRRFPKLGAADPFNARVLHAYLVRTGRIVRLLARAGIRVIVDMHQDSFGSAFANPRAPIPWNAEGAPPWATCTDGKSFIAPLEWPEALAAPPVETAVHHLFANDVRGDLQGQLARVWHAVAAYFRGDRNVLGYELYNEPEDLLSADFTAELECDYGGPAHEPRSCARSHARAPEDGLIGAIRSADPRHVVFYEPPVTTDFGAAESIGISEPLRFGDLALAFHMYTDPATALPLVARERARTRTAQRGGPAWIMDEFGASVTDTSGVSATVGQADALGLSWTYWSALQAHDPTGGPDEGLIDQRTRRPNGPLSAVLAVPYPRATAGTPGRQYFDAATGSFSYRYRVTSSIAAPTEIVLPRTVYPHGYRASVQGARIVSRARADVLELAARRGAATVGVRVTRRGH